MRRMLHILKWIGLSLSTLLLAGTVFCWVRSLGHWEWRGFIRFEPRPEWRTRYLMGMGIERRWYVAAFHGRLWLRSMTEAPVPEFRPMTHCERIPVSADEAKEHFDAFFQPGARTWAGETERARRFAGAGFSHSRDAVDPRIGRPNHEDFSIALPFWMLTVVFGLWPMGFVGWRRLRKKRHAPGHCPGCGYDLRATPDPAGPRLPRCPECGGHSPERYSRERMADT